MIFLKCFCFLAGIDIHDIRIHYYFLTFFFSVFASGPPYGGQWAPSATFHTSWLKPLVTPLSMTEKTGGTLNAFLSETGKLFANVQACNEGSTILRAPNHCGRMIAGAEKSWQGHK